VITSGPRIVTEPGGPLRLREVGPGDADRLYGWRMEPTARAMFRDDSQVPYIAHLGFLARYLRPECADRWFVIEVGGEAIGAIALYGFTEAGDDAHWGRFVIAPSSRGRGWGRRALVLLLAHARELGVRRLHCEVLGGNARAEVMYRSLGFREDGEEEAGGRRFLRLVAELEPAP
jgi:RimJ/RimL family protein N-acetyltransferase